MARVEALGNLLDALVSPWEERPRITLRISTRGDPVVIPPVDYQVQLSLFPLVMPETHLVLEDFRPVCTIGRQCTFRDEAVFMALHELRKARHDAMIILGSCGHDN